MTFVDDHIAFETAPLTPNDVRPVFKQLIETIMSMPDGRAIGELGWLGCQVTAAEVRVLARAQQGGSTARETEDLSDRNRKKSKKQRKTAAKRATTARNNPELVSHIEDGSVTPEQLDALADADTKTDGAASKDADLLETVRSSNGDQSNDAIKSFVEQHNAADEETQHQRQRRLRKVSKFTTKRGTEAILAEGDKSSIERLWKLIGNQAHDLYLSDGGRDLPNRKHPRSHAHRMFDAFVGNFEGSKQPTANDASTAAALSRPANRPTIVLGATINDHGVITDLQQFGVGPLPPSVFARYYCNAELIGMVFDGNGQALWQGRSHRTATRVQLAALIARDRGCVLCRAPHDRCEAHHLIPWNAPLKGKTDIENLALVCQDCHHRIHDLHQTLYFEPQRGGTGVWKLRKATPDEIANQGRPPPPPRE